MDIYQRILLGKKRDSLKNDFTISLPFNTRRLVDNDHDDNDNCQYY